MSGVGGAGRCVSRLPRPPLTRVSLQGAGLPAPARPPEVAVGAAGAGGGGGRGGRGAHPLLRQQGQPAGVERRAVHGQRPRAVVAEGAARQRAVHRAAALGRLPGENGDRRAAGGDFLRAGGGFARCGPKKRGFLGAAAEVTGARLQRGSCRQPAGVRPIHRYSDVHGLETFSWRGRSQATNAT